MFREVEIWIEFKDLEGESTMNLDLLDVETNEEGEGNGSESEFAESSDGDMSDDIEF